MENSKQIITLGERMLTLLYPQRCIICQKLVEMDELFCGGCELVDADADAIKKKGLQFIIRITAVYDYNDDISNAILAMKQYRDKRMTVFYCDRMTEHIRERWGEPAFDVVACVPMSRRGVRKRGYNHAAILGEGIADRLALPFVPDLLLRRNDSLTQRRLDKEQRLENARCSYQTGKHSVTGLRILLVDDVLTTGATVTACAHSLIEHGAKEVSVITICSV